MSSADASDSLLASEVGSKYAITKVKVTLDGALIKAKNTQTGADVMIRKVAFGADGLELSRELRNLRVLNVLQHANLMRIADVPPLRDAIHISSLHYVTDIMVDLEQQLRRGEQLSDAIIRPLAYQMMLGLNYLHSSSVFHQQLRPANIFVNPAGNLKIGNIGILRPTRTPKDGESEAPVTPYYHAPEILWRHRDVESSVDIWAAAMIIGEMYMRRPPLDGNNQAQQVNLILQFIGPPAEGEEETTVLFRSSYSDIHRRQVGRMKRRELDKAAILAAVPADAIDLMLKMMRWLPESRLTAPQCLAHEYFASVRDPTRENVAETPFLWALDMEEAVSHTMAKRMLWNEVAKFNPDMVGESVGMIASGSDNHLAHTADY